MSDEWDPEPASLRDGETTDESAHAQGNLEQLRAFEEDDELPEEIRERARERREDMESDDE